MKKHVSLMLLLTLVAAFFIGMTPHTEASPREQVGVGLVRFGNATTTGVPLQVQVDSVFVANRLLDLVGYFSFNSGEHTVIFRAENGGAEITRATFTLEPGTRKTIMMTGTVPDPAIVIIDDDNTPTVRGDVRFQIVNGIPGSSGLDATFGGESYGSLDYASTTDEITIRAGSYTVGLGEASFDVVLSPGRYYDYVIVGNNPNDARLITWAGRPYRVSGFNRFRFMNLVQAGDGQDPVYSVYVNDDPVPAYQNVDFGQATNEYVVQPGSYNFVFHNQGEELGSTDPVGELQLDIEEDQSLFIIASGSPGDVTFNIFSDNVNPVPVNTARLQVLNLSTSLPEFAVKGPNDVLLVDQAPLGSIVSNEIPGGAYALQLVDASDPTVQVGRAEVNAPSGNLATLVVYDNDEGQQRWVWFNEGLNQVGVVRVVHAARDAGGVDVYLDDTQILNNFAYQDATDYIQLDPGNYNLRLFPAGADIEQANPIWSDNLHIEGNDLAFTIVALGSGENFRVNSYADNLELIPAGQARIRFVNAVANVQFVSFKNAANGGLLAGSLAFGQGSPNINMEASTRTFNVEETGVGSFYSIDGFELLPGAYYTWIIVGDGASADNVDAILLERLP